MDFPRLGTAPDVLELYVRAHDAGPTTYVIWQWHDDPAGETIGDHAFALDAATWEPARIALDGALASGVEANLREVLTVGALSSVDAERTLSLHLAETILPREFWLQVDRAHAARSTIRLRLCPSQRLAAVPWELLVSPTSDTRLIAMATIAYEVPYTVHWSRPRLPGADAIATSAPLYTIDVAPGAGAHMNEVLTPAGRRLVAARLGIDPVTRPRLSRAELATSLQANPSHWLYVGHVSAGNEVGLASLHLSDGVTGSATSSTAELSIQPPWFGFAPLEGSHRPLCARDLYLGTQSPDAERAATTGQARLPAPPYTSGAAIWPMPRSVGLVACASGADHGASEVFGLATAVLSGGAEWVVATRWILPTDLAPTILAAGRQDAMPLTELLFAVDDALSLSDPVAAIRDWQLDRLGRWEAIGDLANSPLWWASLMTYWMPARPDLRDPDLESPRTSLSVP